MSRTVLRIASAAAVFTASLTSMATAQLQADRFWPKSVLKRFDIESLPALEYPSYYGELEKARALLFRGRYRNALYDTFGISPDLAAEAAMIRAEAYWRIGEIELARTTLRDLAGEAEADFLQSRIDLAEGDAASAIRRLQPLVESHPARITYRHWLAMAYEAAGDLDEAVAHHAKIADGDEGVLARFESADGAMAFESAEDLTLGAISTDRWATITQQYRNRADLHDVVLSMFVGAYDVVDREYWPAHLEAAKYLLAHGNRREAVAELDLANAANPNDSGVNILMGQMQVTARSEAGIAEAIRALRAVDPRSFAADLLDIRAKLLRRSFSDALALAQRCVERQPRQLEALALLAACHAAIDDSASMTRTLTAIDAVDPDNAAARVVIAEVVSTVYYDAAGAVPLLEEAIDRAPWWTEPQHALGVALIQEGEESRARVVLDRAHAVDPYNAITVNYLRVLDLMAKFQEFESERFIFRYDEREDPIVPLYIAPQMDAMYDDLVKRYGYAPEKKPIIEIFPDAQTFSARTTGMPGLETYGASLGRVMTSVAPRAGETLGPFNWARVLRHEFTHTINLMQTKGRVPRWLTEGLAVWEEGVPYRFANVPEQLYTLAANEKMPTPSEMRMVRSEMHYMTGFWIVRYIEATHGWDGVLKLINAYGEGKEEDTAFIAATGDNANVFHQKFSAWAKNEVKDWGYDQKTKKDVEALTKEANDLIRDSQFEASIEKWEEVAKRQPMNPLPPRRLAGIYLRLEKPAEALPHLIATLPLELADNRYAKRVSRVYDQANDAANAMKYADFAIHIDPYDPDAHTLLADLHTKAGNEAEAQQHKEVATLLTSRRARTDR